MAMVDPASVLSPGRNSQIKRNQPEEKVSSDTFEVRWVSPGTRIFFSNCFTCRSRFFLFTLKFCSCQTFRTHLEILASSWKSQSWVQSPIVNKTTTVSTPNHHTTQTFVTKNNGAPQKQMGPQGKNRLPQETRAHAIQTATPDHPKVVFQEIIKLHKFCV